MSIEFERIACVCEHAETDHDDGFGCTERDCDCTASWVWTSDPPSPDTSGLFAYWDRVAPLPVEPPPAPPDSPAKIARDIRLRTIAARQVEESRRERGAEP